MASTTTPTSATMPSTSMAAKEKKDEVMIDRLPPYFPTTCKTCASVTEAFFTCFEAHAVMQTATDTQTAKHALAYCQPELRAYMQCMEKHIAAKDRPRHWWKVW